VSKRGASLNGYFYIGLSVVKTAADRHRRAAYHNKYDDVIFNGINIDDLERP